MKIGVALILPRKAKETSKGNFSKRVLSSCQDSCAPTIRPPSSYRSQMFIWRRFRIQLRYPIAVMGANNEGRDLLEVRLGWMTG